MICPHCYAEVELDHLHVADPEDIIEICCNYFNIHPAVLAKRERKHQVAAARHVAMFLIRKYTRLTLKEIGDRFKKDHTSVIHGVQRVNDAFDTKMDVYQDVVKLMGVVEQKVA
jgi:chromosomal replication initiator protein